MWDRRLALALLLRSNREAQRRWLYHNVARLDVRASMYSNATFQKVSSLLDWYRTLESFRTKLPRIFCVGPNSA